ncbi:hypothetical protein [Cloacibacillus sp.]|nr:hypothetical protein [Cloacibacillus sp.]
MINFIIMPFSAAAFVYLIISITLLFMGIENAVFNISDSEREPILSPFKRFIEGKIRHEKKKAPRALYLSCLFLIAVYFFIPMGSLPQFFSVRGGFLIAVSLLILAQNFYIRGLKQYSKEIYFSIDINQINILFKFTVALLLVIITLAWFVINIGVPGSIFCLNTYAAMPLAIVTNFWGRIGLVFFFFSLAVVSPCRKVRQTELTEYISLFEVYDAVRSTLCPAIITAIFVPVNIGLLLRLAGIPMYAADFAFFWFKVLIVQIVVIPPIRAAYMKMRERLPLGWKSSPYLLLSYCGVALFLVNLYL